MGEFTKGPWRKDGPDMFGDFNILHQADSLAVAAVVSNLRQPGEVEANASLVTAAGTAATAVEALGYDGQDAIEKLPEMVEALEKSNSAFDSLCMAGHMHLVSGALLDGFGMDTIRAALPTRLAESE